MRLSLQCARCTHSVVCKLVLFLKKQRSVSLTDAYTKLVRGLAPPRMQSALIFLASLIVIVPRCFLVMFDCGSKSRHFSCRSHLGKENYPPSLAAAVMFAIPIVWIICMCKYQDSEINKCVWTIRSR